MEIRINEKTWVRGFHWTSRAWYSDVVQRKDISFGLYDPKGNGCLAEMRVSWVDIGELKEVPRLEIFSESWAVFASFTDLIGELAKVHGEHVTQERFVEILKRSNFLDLTRYKDPYKDEEEDV